jgi:hypothetical protein
MKDQPAERKNSDRVQQGATNISLQRLKTHQEGPLQQLAKQ